MMQLFFDFFDKTDEIGEFIISEENRHSFDFLSHFFLQTEFSSAAIKAMILKGESGSGKTHLTKIFIKKYRATILKKYDVQNENLSKFFEKNKFYILENIDEFFDDELLLRLINCAFESNSFLLLTTIFTSGFSLKDLTSRLQNTISTEILPPKSHLIKILLQKEFSKRQIKIDDEIINYSAEKIERKYARILDFVRVVELYSCEKKMSLKSIKNFLK
jgi:chromosomal replication initiation ATPase DnaA